MQKIKRIFFYFTFFYKIFNESFYLIIVLLNFYRNDYL